MRGGRYIYLCLSPKKSGYVLAGSFVMDRSGLRLSRLRPAPQSPARALRSVLRGLRSGTEAMSCSKPCMASLTERGNLTGCAV